MTARSQSTFKLSLFFSHAARKSGCSDSFEVKVIMKLIVLASLGECLGSTMFRTEERSPALLFHIPDGLIVPVNF